MTLIQAHYYREVCEAGSLSEASARLHVAASTLSQSIMELENEFGLKLMNRTNRGMAPTPEGFILLEHIRRLIREEDSTLRAMWDLSNASFSIKLGIPAIACDVVWPKLSGFIYAHYPNIRMDIITAMGKNELFYQLDNSELDALVMIHPPEEKRAYNMLALWPAPKLALVVSEKNPLACKSHVCFEDVLDIPLVRHVSDNKAAFLQPLYAQYGKEPRFIETCEQLSTMMGLIRNGVAAAYLNTEIAQHYEGVRALFVPEQEQLYYYLIWKRVDHIRRPLLKFLKIINDLLLESSVE